MVMIAIATFAHLVLPALLLFWLVRMKGKSQFLRISAVILVCSFMVFMWIAGAGWHIFGRWWSWLFLVSFFPAAFVPLKNIKGSPLWPHKNIMPWLNGLFVFGLALIFTLSIPELLASRSFEGKALELVFPMRGGIYHIIHGGSSETMNYHFVVPAQRFALDIVEVGRLGLRAKGFMPKKLESYEIYGEELVAPCSGEVLSARGDLEDNIPPHADRENIVGNHVILFCQEHSVVLAHMKKGSIEVESGQIVDKGILIGRVGNSGNTSEPHLHIHAVEGRHSEATEVATTAKATPMTFDGKFLIRNDQISFDHLRAKAF